MVPVFSTSIIWRCAANKTPPQPIWLAEFFIAAIRSTIILKHYARAGSIAKSSKGAPAAKPR
jgi:hypothetical protein